MDLPDALLVGDPPCVNNPSAVAGGGWIFGIGALMGDLFRAAAIGLGDPNLEMPCTIGAPNDVLAIGHKGGIPVLGWIVREAMHSAGLGRNLPEISVAASRGGENDPLTVR